MFQLNVKHPFPESDSTKDRTQSHNPTEYFTVTDDFSVNGYHCPYAPLRGQHLDEGDCIELLIIALF